MYNIKKYSYDQAKKLNVIIVPSKNKLKKIDVYNNKGDLLHSIGNINYFDYPTYLQLDESLAKNERKLYKDLIKRLDCTWEKGTAGYYADKILW